MSRWSDQFKGNKIQITIAQLIEWLDVDAGDISAEHEEEKRRLKKALQSVFETVGVLDPEFFPDRPLDELVEQLRQPALLENLEAYSKDHEIQRLRDANDHVTTMAANVFRLAAVAGQPKAQQKISAIEKAYDAFCAKIEQREHDADAKRSEYDARLESLGNNTTALENAQKDLQKNTAAAMGGWQSEYTGSHTKRAEDFSQAQIERTTKFEEAVREWRATSEGEIEAVTSKHDEDLKTAFSAYIKDAKALMADMKAKHEAILEIHGLVGTDGVAGGYQKGATDEHKAANRWRFYSVLAVVAAVGLLLFKYVMGFELSSTGKFNWAELATAASLTAILIGLSTYAARQSTLHRKAEQQMKWFALEVKAIDPFLASLEPKERQALKKQLAPTYFGQNHATTEEE